MTKAQADRAVRVLVIDASAHIRRLIGTLLRAVSIPAFVEARNPAEAVLRVAEGPLDLVIADLSGDPTEVLMFVHHLRRGEFGDAAVPVLGMIPACHHAVLDYARDAGVTEMIGKPVSAIEVIGRVGGLLRARFEARLGEPPLRLAAE